MRRAPLKRPAPSTPPLGETIDFMRLIWAIDHGLQTTSKRMHRTLGATGPQRLVIRIVGKFPGASAGQLADILHIDPSTLTGVLQRLARRGLLARRRDPRDGRRVLLTLTAKGRALDVPAAGTVETAVERALAGLTKHKTAATRQVLAALAAALDGPT